MDSSHKRPRYPGTSDGLPNKKFRAAADAGNSGSGGSGKMSLAEKMMAKMGYVQGQGLGKEAHGMLNPIEVKLRPQGAGVGAVKEKTPQAKAEARRAAQQRGQEYEDSSEEERNARKAKKQAARLGGSAGASGRAAVRAKQKIRTVAEIEAEGGLEIPNVFKSLIDMTGSQPKLLTSTAGLFATRHSTVVSAESEADKLARYARKELDAFDEAWRGIQDRRRYVDVQSQRVQDEILAREVATNHLRQMTDVVLSLSSFKFPSPTLDETYVEIRQSIEPTIQKLELLQSRFPEEASEYNLSEIAVAALNPFFKQFISQWQPLDNSDEFVTYLERLRPLLLGASEADNHTAADNFANLTYQQRSAGPYESMLYTSWLPKMRSVIVNDWDPVDASAMLAILTTWRNVLPFAIHDILVNQLVVQKLSDALRKWKPGRSQQRKDDPSIEPHLWLFPWLEHLDEYHLHPKIYTSLLAEVRRKLRSAFDKWTPRDGVFPGLERWREVRVLRSELDKDLELRLLPVLAQYLSSHFKVFPADQDLTPLEHVLEWAPFFKPEKFARLFLDAFFPKWHGELYYWLTSEPNYKQVSEWCSWWQTVFPDSLNSVSAISNEWDRGLKMVKQAQDLGPERVASELAKPVIRSSSMLVNDVKVDHAATGAAVHIPQKESLTATGEVEVTLKDLLEGLCEQENLLLIPLRKAHDATGLPLYRVTANAAGTGGAVLYIQGDIVYVQNKKNRAVWDLTDPFADGALVSLAEGK